MEIGFVKYPRKTRIATSLFIVFRAIRCDRHDRNSDACRAKRLRRSVTIHHGHLNIHQDQIKDSRCIVFTASCPLQANRHSA